MSIPFTYKQGFIIVDFHFQYLLPFSFIFDTGAQNTVIFDKKNTDIINTSYAKEISIMGADFSVEILALIARNINLSNFDKKISIERDVLVLKEDIVLLNQIIGKEIHGILGANVFKGLVVEVNFHKRLITFYDPASFNPKRYKSYNVSPLKIINSKPYIQATSFLRGKKIDSLEYLIDSGASLSLLFQSNTENKLELPENVIEGSLGKGLGGDIMGYVGLIDSFKIGKDITFVRPISYFQKIDSSQNSSLLKRDGIIGNTILDRFHFVIDYQNHKFYFKPNKNFEDKFRYDKTGISVIAAGDRLHTYIVSRVLKGSPADIAGIKKGDVITKVKWRSNLFLTLESISRYFTDKEGKKITLTIRRRDQKLKKEFYLKDFFKN